MNLDDAVASFYARRDQQHRDAVAAELRAFKPDADLDDAVTRLDEMKARGDVPLWGSNAERVEAYARRREQARALRDEHRLPDGSTYTEPDEQPDPPAAA